MVSPDQSTQPLNLDHSHAPTFAEPSAEQPSNKKVHGNEDINDTSNGNDGKKKLDRKETKPGTIRTAQISLTQAKTPRRKPSHLFVTDVPVKKEWRRRGIRPNKSKSFRQCKRTGSMRELLASRNEVAAANIFMGVESEFSRTHCTWN